MNDCIEELLQNNKQNLAIGGSRRNILSSSLYSPSRIYCFDRLENIANYPIALYMQKNSNFKDKIDNVILTLSQFGLIEKWNTEITGLSPNNKHSKGNNTPHQLKMENIMAVILFVVCTGTMISTSTFLVEKYIFWKMAQRRKAKIFIYLDQFVDGQRHYLKNLDEEEENFVYLP